MHTVPEVRDWCWRSTPAWSQALPPPRQWDLDWSTRVTAAIPAAAPTAKPIPPLTRKSVPASRGPSTYAPVGGAVTTTGTATGTIGASGAGATGTPGGM